ncbi:hypothetical protein BSIN_2864 [Burkholderia singularis]|uniref:Uncharacterized protein n=1 Tax=Burkholderia singularis TaxID=1503053 RepID=A0A238H374_9BURK|nr:hypothetical protein BSIN_2864 [Burkholderia singularis]
MTSLADSFGADAASAAASGDGSLAATVNPQKPANTATQAALAAERMTDFIQYSQKS